MVAYSVGQKAMLRAVVKAEPMVALLAAYLVYYWVAHLGIWMGAQKELTMVECLAGLKAALKVDYSADMMVYLMAACLAAWMAPKRDECLVAWMVEKMARL